MKINAWIRAFNARAEEIGHGIRARPAAGETSPAQKYAIETNRDTVSMVYDPSADGCLVIAEMQPEGAADGLCAYCRIS